MTLHFAKIKISKETLIKKLREIEKTCTTNVNGKDCYDAEKGHKKADELLLQYIGDHEVSEIFDDLEKWYS